MLLILLILSTISSSQHNNVESAHILALLTTPFPSHTIWGRSLLRTLAARGHHITVLTPFPDPDPHPNWRDIVIDNILESSREDFHYEQLLGSNTVANLIANVDFVGMVQNVDRRGMSSNGTKALLNSTEVYDLIITDLTFGECYLGFVHKFGYPPVIGIVPYGYNPWIGDLFGNSDLSSYIPHQLAPYGDVMDFRSRTINVLVKICEKLYYGLWQLPLMNRIARQHFGDALPSVSDIAKHISLVMVNTHESFDYPRPLVPNIIPVGGMHIKEKKTLPKNLQKFLDEAAHGVIYFSLGTNVKRDTISPQILNEVIATFRVLPQRILWKWQTDQGLPVLPPNVLVRDWLPQNDILGHPNVCLFISHGGLLSLQEAVFHGVPIVATPFFGDQHYHAEMVVVREIGVKINFLKINKQRLLGAIKTVLNNPRYLSNAKQLSRLYTDRPDSPLDRAVYWTEFVMRHKGAAHLRSSAAGMSWYQLYLLDVAAGLLLATLALVCGSVVTVRAVLRRVALTSLQYLKWKLD